MNYMLNHDLTPGEIINKLDLCIQAMTRRNAELKTLAIKKAKAEQAYRVAVAKEILRLKVEKYPAALINGMVKGNEMVANLKVERDIAESAYFTAISAMDNLKTEVEILRSQLSWLRAEYKNS